MPAFLLNPRIIGALALALAFGGLYLWGSYQKSGRLKAELALEQCRGQVAVITQSLETQSAAVQTLAKTQQNKVAEAARKAQDARKAAEGLGVQVKSLETLLEAYKAAPKDQTCVDAVRQYRETLR